jgi:hypothetical protein
MNRASQVTPLSHPLAGAGALRGLEGSASSSMVSFGMRLGSVRPLDCGEAGDS